MADSLQARLMGQGLRLLNRIAGARLLDNPRIRKQFARALFGTSRTGFKTATIASRPFKALNQLGKAARPVARVPTGLFDLSPDDEQQMIVDAVQRYATDQLRPQAAQAESTQKLSKPQRDGANELGLNAMVVPESLGGVANDAHACSAVLIAEALAHGDMGQACALLCGSSVASALVQYGSAEQQARYLPALCGAAPPVAAMAIHEDAPLFDLRRQNTRAARQAEGYVLNGEKSLVMGAGEAELFLVAAQLEDRPALFVVESGQEGLSWERQPAMGLRAAGLCRLRLKQVRLNADSRLDGEHWNLEDFVARSRLAWCALATGTAQAVLDYVIPYCNERQAFGEPISHRQSVAFMIADMAIELEGLRLATRRAAARADHGKSFTHEAQLAHQLAVQHSRTIASHGVQLLGGHGFVKEHPVERWYRDLLAVGNLQYGLMV